MSTQTVTEKEKLAQSKILVNFVHEHNQTWNHQEWLDLVADVRKKGYTTLAEDEIGLLLEGEKAKQLNVPAKAAQRSSKTK